MSKKPRKPLDQAAIDRPFAPDIWARARRIAEQYQVVMSLEDGEWYGRGLELPMTMDDGKTPDECIANVREALTATVAYMLEHGERPPSPLSDSARTAQVNIRLTAGEKTILEHAARAHGFKGVSDYIRARILSGANAA